MNSDKISVYCSQICISVLRSQSNGRELGSEWVEKYSFQKLHMSSSEIQSFTDTKNLPMSPRIFQNWCLQSFPYPHRFALSMQKRRMFIYYPSLVTPTDISHCRVYQTQSQLEIGHLSFFCCFQHFFSILKQSCHFRLIHTQGVE